MCMKHKKPDDVPRHWEPTASLFYILRADPNVPVHVDYKVTGTATGGGVDYTLADGTLEFNAGETTKNISIAIVDDAVVDVGETIILTITPKAGDVVLGATTTHTFTINDND